MRRTARVLIVVTIALAFGACQVDPTTGHPPPIGQPAPPYQSSITTVTADDLPYTWRPGCPVGPEDLRLLTLTNWGYDGNAYTGAMVVHRDVVGVVDTIFRYLYDQRFQIERIVPIDAYQGDDDLSMANNNTSAFNCRAVTGGTAWSEHSYGSAIDINPVQNPYVSGGTVAPEAGRNYLNRADVVPGMIVSPGPVVDAFRYNGWGWGGDWTSKKDYQHVSLTGR
jgi:hypothetical protein